MVLFHGATLDLLGIQDSMNEDPVRDLERILGVRLPRSVAEWFALPQCVDFLTGNCEDEVITLSSLSLPIDVGDGVVRRDLLREGRLVVARQNQRMCTWAVPLFGDDDPQVLVAMEAELPGQESWTTYVPAFSTFVYTLAWDCRAFGAAPYSLTTQDGPLRSQDLELLRSRFVARPVTRGWPAETSYRFERRGQRVIVFSAPDSAEWWLLADTEEDLDTLRRDLAEACTRRRDLAG